jgi:hypothetical protein
MKPLLALLALVNTVGAVNVSTSTSPYFTTGQVNTFSHTCTTGDNIGLFVMIVGRVATAVSNLPTSVTWQSGPAGGPVIQLTKNPTNGDTAGGVIVAEAWSMFACPPGQAGTITITLVSDQGAGSNERFMAMAISVDNVNFTNPVTSMTGSAVANLVTSTATMTALTNSIFMAIAEGGNTQTFTGFAVSAGTPHELFNTNATTRDRVAGGYSDPLSAGSHTISWVSNAADFRTFLAISVSQMAYPTTSGTLLQTYATPIISATGSQTSGDANTGDTFLGDGGWSTATLAAGNLAGGANFMNSNDGHPVGYVCPTSYAVCVLKLTNLDKITPANTVVAAGPNMTSYGPLTSPGVTTCAGRTGWNNKSRASLVLQNQLLTPIGCPNDAFNDWAEEGWIVSPDGINSCNFGTWTIGGDSCTIANWSSTGDAPTSGAEYQWDDLTGNNMQALQAVGTAVQGDPCFHSVPVGMDPNFIYFYSLGYSRTPCTVTDVMTPGSYRFRKSDGTWSATRSDMNTTNTLPVNGLNSLTWDRFHNAFLSMSDAHHGYSYASFVGGAFTARSPINATDYQFQSLSPSFLQVQAGRVTGVSSLNGPGSNTARFEYLDLGPANPTWGIAQ